MRLQVCFPFLVFNPLRNVLMYRMELVCHKFDEIDIFLIVIVDMVTNNVDIITEP